MQLAHLMIDAEAAEGGTWRPAVGLPGIAFRVRGVDNLDWRRLNAKLMAELPRKKQLAVSLDPEDEDAITGVLLHRTVLPDCAASPRRAARRTPMTGPAPSPC